MWSKVNFQLSLFISDELNVHEKSKIYAGACINDCI